MPESAPAKADTRRTIAGLHYLRALATLSVVFVHVFSVSAKPEYYGVQPFGGFLRFPASEIDLFFSMSGFLMLATTYHATTGKPRMTAADFLARRFARIFPLLWIGVASYAALRFVGMGQRDFSGALRAATAWPIGPVDPNVAWTIRYEVYFYLAFALFFLRFPKYKWWSVAWFLLPLGYATITGAWTESEGTLPFFLTNPFNLEFGLGVAIAALHRRFDRAPIILRYQLPILIALFVGFRALLFSLGLMDPVGQMEIVAHNFLFCLLVIGIALRTEPARINRVMIFFGDASFSIFLFHPHFLSPAFMVMKRLAPDCAGWLAASLIWVMCIAATSLVHILIERPIVKHANLMLHSFPTLRRLKAVA